MMRMSIDNELLTGQQLEALSFLQDGEWHDRRYIHNKMGFKKYDYSIISERIIKPLEAKGIVEQEGRPGTRKLFVRIRKDLDEQSLHELHLLIEYSANALVMKYRGKNRERSQFFLEIRNKSIEKCSELEKIEEERKRKEEVAYWDKRHHAMDLDRWHELIAIEKVIYEALKPGCKVCCEKGKCREADCYPLKKPGVSFKIATALRTDLWNQIIQHERKEAISDDSKMGKPDP